MIKQLVLMLLLSLLAGLIFGSHEMALLPVNQKSYLYLFSYIIGYALALSAISIALALIPCGIYRILRIKRPPDFIVSAWSFWILIIILNACSLVYKSIPQEAPAKPPIVADTKTTAEKVYKKVINSIYSISSSDSNNDSSAYGGAVAVTADYLATNCHIIINSKNISVLVNQEEMPAELYSAHRDLCILTVPGVKFSPVQLRRAKDVNIGEDVYAIGNPQSFSKTISDGIISNKINAGGLIMLQTNAAISSGSSGGGLFDHNGILIGITNLTWVKDQAQNINFALPTEMIEAAILEPVIDSKFINKTSETTTEPTDENKPKTAPHSQQKLSIPAADSYEVIGTYGKDKIVLAYWNHVCFILIPGRYNPETIKSVAVWTPSSPNFIVILSRVTSIDGVFRFVKWTLTTDDITHSESKSFIFYDNKLKPLTIFTIDGVKQPAYIHLQKKPLTEDLIAEDNLIAQFYDYNQTGYQGLTSIEFGLAGFTEALDNYNKQCASE